VTTGLALGDGEAVVWATGWAEFREQATSRKIRPITKRRIALFKRHVTGERFSWPPSLPRRDWVS
jgi:hypothetical protein